MGEDIGLRTIQHQGQSPHSGEFVVEDVEGDAGSLFRRLIFLSNQNAIQSEVRLLKGAAWIFFRFYINWSTITNNIWEEERKFH